MADIPGIIEGAADGKGLGVRFLRHIERNPVLLFLIPADEDDIVAAYRTLLGELEKYNPQMLDKQRILAISKSDLLYGRIGRRNEVSAPERSAEFESIVFQFDGPQEFGHVKRPNYGCHRRRKSRYGTLQGALRSTSASTR